MVRGLRAVWSAGCLGLCLAAALGALTACAESSQTATEVLVVLRSDLSVPEQLDLVEVSAVGPDGREQRAAATLSAADGLPKTIALVHTGGATEPLRVIVSGQKDRNEVVRRSATLAFLPGKQLVLDLWLLSSCLNQVCAEGTCTERGCASDEIDVQALPGLQGSVESIEGEYVPPPEQWSAADAGTALDAEPISGEEDAAAEASVADADAGEQGEDAGGGILDPPGGGIDAALPSDAAAPRDAQSPTDGGHEGGAMWGDAALYQDARVPTSMSDGGCTPSQDCITRCLLANRALRAIVCSCALVCS